MRDKENELFKALDPQLQAIAEIENVTERQLELEYFIETTQDSFNSLRLEPLGSSSIAFVELLYRMYGNWIEDKVDVDSTLQLWIYAEIYIVSKYAVHTDIDPDLVLDAIEKNLMEINSKCQQDKSRGIHILPLEFADPKLIRAVYVTNDMGLMTCFARHFPVPKGGFFKEKEMPFFVRTDLDASRNTIKAFVARQKGYSSLEALEVPVKKAQRTVRSFLRQKHENLMFFSKISDFHLFSSENTIQFLQG